MSRPTTAHIRLDAFRHNYQIAKKMHGGKSLAVIKANAYGHGAVQCAKSIANEADGFAVACLEEALQLRQENINNPILLLEGFFEAAELPEIIANDCWIVVHAMWQVDILMACKLASSLHVWLKLDSGMHRLGLSLCEFKAAFKLLNRHQNVAKIVLMSHFANADNLTALRLIENVELTQTLINSAFLDPLQQIIQFDLAVSTLDAKYLKPVNSKSSHFTSMEYSLANSAAVLAWLHSARSWSRPGIMLYGANPLDANAGNVRLLSEVDKRVVTQLRPVMRLTSSIISIRLISTGESLGYGSIFTANRDTSVGVVACGYADGYPRSAGSCGFDAPVAVEGQITKIIGRVSMDMLMVDLTDVNNAKIGSTVELWGDQILANQVAKAAGTIAYELFCNVKRVKFIYTDTEFI